MHHATVLQLHKRMYLDVLLDLDLYGACSTALERELAHWQGLEEEMGKLRAWCYGSEDGIRDCLLSRGLGDVYKRQGIGWLRPLLF